MASAGAAGMIGTIVSAREAKMRTKERDTSPDESSSCEAAETNPLSYPQSSLPFSQALFENPTSEYRGCPFWAWNARLDRAQALRQIDCFQEMGLGGFHMHVRTGLDTEYMGEEFMSVVRACAEYAEEKGMLACLYDEDRWPSGAAGGLVTKSHPEHKGKHIRFTPRAYESDADNMDTSNERGYLLARFAVQLNEAGELKKCWKLPNNERGKAVTDATVWYAYVESTPTGKPTEWYNGQSYIDTMSREAVDRFIAITHEAYKEKVGDKFGTTIPCIFTDEPQYATRKSQLSSPQALEDVYLPWTPALDADAELVAGLPQVVWDLLGRQPSLARYRYHNEVSERFVSAFLDTVGAWCGRNGLKLTGHLMEEPTLWSQTTCTGEAMRCYRAMQLPGIDLLNDGVELNTAKQAASVARQKGARGAMSEIYGCTHWYFTFEGHKGCGDWQAALGITFRVQHLAWLSMAGEAKRDYPASINYQSPWCREYGYVEDHFARVAVAMTRGRAVTRVAVVHPIESFWLCYGPRGGGGAEEAAWRDRAFADLTAWLLHGLVDFDFISESLLPEQYGGTRGGRLHVGACRYDAVILPNLRTVRFSTLRLLSQFARAGGRVIVAGAAPDRANAKFVDHPADFVERHCERVAWRREDILAAVEAYREIRVTRERGGRRGGAVDTLLYQMRQEGEKEEGVKCRGKGSVERFVFICNTDRDEPVDTIIELRGEWDVTLLDTLSGRSSRVSTLEEAGCGWTSFAHRFEGCGSVLLRLLPSSSSHESFVTRRLKPGYLPPRCFPFAYGASPPPLGSATGVVQPLELLETTLSEPNVLMLDYAGYKLDGDAGWSAPTEVLRIDNLIRARLGLPRKGGAWRQPWTVAPSERAPRARATLRFKFASEVELGAGGLLALEDAATTEICVNGVSLSAPAKSAGEGKGVGVGEEVGEEVGEGEWWVDEAIAVVPIPEGTIHRGVNVVTLSFSFGVLTNVERVYLLGQFGVHLEGHKATLKPWPSSAGGKPQPELAWGDIVPQGLPFYAGNVTYRCRFSVSAPSAAVTLSAPAFSSPVLAVEMRMRMHGDEKKKKKKKKGYIAVQPRALCLGALGRGEHEVEITAFGNRYNAFGHVHVPEGVWGCWPDMWRTDGSAWTDDYALRPIGVLACPGVSMQLRAWDDDGDDSDNKAGFASPPALEASSDSGACGSPPGWVVVRRPGSESGSEPDSDYDCDYDCGWEE